MIACTIGNPMPRSSKASLTLRFDSNSLEDVDPFLTFTVFANTTSKLPNPARDMLLKVYVVKEATLTISGYVRTII